MSLFKSLRISFALKGISKLSFIGLLFLVSNCNKEQFDIQNLNGSKIYAFGHAGMGYKGNAPMNSFQSILDCYFEKANGTEIDIQLSKDSVLVLFHDELLDEKTNLKGKINALTWEEISQGLYDDKSEHAIISLDSLFSYYFLSNLGFSFTLDCKLYSAGNHSEFKNIFSRAVKKLIDKYNAHNFCSIESTDVSFLNSFKQKKTL
jgi:glycerophosphoryl diester phosphodiesterase